MNLSKKRKGCKGGCGWKKEKENVIIIYNLNEKKHRKERIN